MSRKLKDRKVNVVPIDSNTRDNPEIQVCPYDATLFPFSQHHVVVLARPCHGSWVQDTIANALEQRAEVLYISKEENIEKDLEPEWVSKPIKTSCGEDGEITISIKANEAKDMTHWYLVERKFHTGGFFKPEWRIKEEHHGMKCWGSTAGGFCPIGEEDKVLEEIYLADDEELDWTKTYLNMPDEDETAGWLDRNGKMYLCDSQKHDQFADLILKKTVSQLEKTGWCRVYGVTSTPQFSCHKRLSAEQRNYLSANGFVMKDWC